MNARSLGFTIIELMITVAVLAVALGIAVPNLQQFIQNNRLISQLNLLSSSLALARSEAVKSNSQVVVCRTNDAGLADLSQPACNDTGALWSEGWIVFVDRDGDFTIDYTAGQDGCADAAPDTVDCVLAIQGELTGSAEMRGASDVPDLIAYGGTGAAQCDDGSGGRKACANDNTYFVLCDNRGAEHARALAVSRTGRASALDTKPNGTALSCTP